MLMAHLTAKNLVPDPFNTGIQPDDLKDLWEERTIQLESLKVTANFIKDICNATLDVLHPSAYLWCTHYLLVLFC